MRQWVAVFALLVSASTANGQPWRDDFDRGRLHARWTWRAPVAGPTFSLTDRPGWLRLSLPQRENGFNHWNDPTPVDDAPQMRTPAPKGDWELEAHLQVQQIGADSHAHVGLVVGESDAQILTWGPMQGPNLPDGPKVPEAWLEPTGTSGYWRVPGEARDVVLRLVKRGRWVQALLRRGGGGWVDGGAYPLTQEAQFVGVMAKSFGGGSGVTVDVDYVRMRGLGAGEGLPAVETGRPELLGLGKRVRGFVVWESNRSGHWELYRMNTDGTGFRQLTHLAKPGDLLAWDGYLWPRVSPDGSTVLFYYGRKGGPAQTWVVASDGSGVRKLLDGQALNWTPDGQGILFVRDRQLWRYEYPSGKESRVHPVQLPEPGRGVIGSVGADLKAVQMRTPQTNEYFVLDQGRTIKTMGGCESRLTVEGRYAYWVQGPKDFRVWDVVNDREWQMLGEPSSRPHNYTYFPTVSADRRWLAYGASPGQHDHETSDYEVFLVELQEMKAVGDPVRLSWHPKTDRWPFLWVEKRAPRSNRGSRSPSDKGGAVAGAHDHDEMVGSGSCSGREHCRVGSGGTPAHGAHSV